MKKIKYLVSKLCYLIVQGADYYKIYYRSFDAQISASAKLSAETTILNHLKDRTKIKVGERCVLNGPELVLYGHGGEIVIGENCFIGKDTKIWSCKRIVIGNNVLIAHNVNIHDSGSHPLNSVERQKDFEYFFQTGKLRENQEFDLKEADVIIHDNAWLGFNSTITKGVTIGKGAIVGAYSFVTKDVPDYAVVVGNPAKIIKYTD